MNEHLLAVWRSLMEFGTQFLGKGLYQDAETYFQQSLSLAKELLVPEILAFTLRLLSTSRVKLAKLDEAEVGFREALRICEEIQNGKGMAEAWAGLASVAVSKGSLAEAREWYEHSIAVYPSSSPPLRLGMLYSDLGQVYAAMENWPKAEYSYIRAKESCSLYGYRKGEGELDVLLGEIYYRQGRKKQAQSWLMKACQVFAQIPENNSLANSLQYLAFMYYDLGDMEESQLCQQRAVALWLRLNDAEEITESCYFLSKIEQNLGLIEEAENHLEVSLKYYSGQDLGLALRYQSLASISVMKHDLSAAEKYLLQSLDLFLSLKDDLKTGEIYEALAYVAEAQGREKEALEFHHKSCQSYNGNEFKTYHAIHRLGQFYEKHHYYLDAIQCYWQALEVARELGENVKTVESDIQRVSRRIRRKKSNV